MQVLCQHQHAPNRDVKLPNNAQIDPLQQLTIVEHEQPNIKDNNADLQSFINMMLTWNWRKNKPLLSKQEQSLNR